jgi:hypothetical protein
MDAVFAGRSEPDGSSTADTGDDKEDRKLPPSVKAKFTPEEDARLLQIVTDFGTGDWNLIAFLHNTRNPRQCRDRYHNYLAPELRSDRWTHEEDALLVEKYIEHGTKWNKIAEFFQNRSANSIRNRWQVFARRQARTWKEAGLSVPLFAPGGPWPWFPTQVPDRPAKPSKQRAADSKSTAKPESVYTITDQENLLSELFELEEDCTSDSSAEDWTDGPF